MTEIYNDIPEEVKAKTRFWFEVALAQASTSDMFRMLREYRNSCTNEYEKEYVDFYMNMRMESILESTK